MFPVPENQIVSIDIALFGDLPIGADGENISNEGEHRMHDEIIVVRSIKPILHIEDRLLLPRALEC